MRKLEKPLMGAKQAPPPVEPEEDVEAEVPEAAPVEEDPAPAAPEEEPMAAPGEEVPQDGEQASPEEQQQYEQFYANAIELIYSEKGDYAMLKQVLDRLRKGEDPIEGLAAVATSVFMALVTSASKKGVQISPDVMMQGGYDIVADLAELAGRAKVHTYTEEETEGAYYRAADMVREQMQNAGMLDAEKSATELEMLRQAEESGQLDDVLPGATEAAKRLGSKAAPTPAPEEGADEAAEPEDDDAPPVEAAPPPTDEEDDKPKGMRPKGK